MVMAPERVHHAISFQMGEIHALFMFAQMLARQHHSPKALLPHLAEIEQLGLAGIEPHPVPDATIEGFQFVIEGLRKAIAELR